MIKGEEIGKLIAQPTSVGKSHLDDLAVLLEKYPYCSSLYILQLSGLSNADHISFEEKLKLAASNVPDREHLFWIVNQDSKVEEVIVETTSETIEEKPKEELVIETATASDEAVTSKEEEIVEEVVEQVIEDIKEEKEKTVPEKIEPEEIVIDPVVSEEVEIEEQAVEDPELSSLEAEIMSSVVESALSLAPEEYIGEKEAEESEEEIPETAVEQPAPIERPENMTFIEWLQYKQAIVAGEKPKEVQRETEKSLTEEIKEAKSMSKKEINALLDKFIEEEPSLSAPKKEFYDAGGNAKKSLEESLDIVSETLAKIHFMQGNYSKAISAYKQLSLLYPEKKVFFATQIEKIKEKQNK